MQAVIDELVDVGYSRLTSAGVARRAKVSTATMYRRWSTKRELILAAAASAGSQQIFTPDTGTLTGDLAAFVDAKNQLLAGRTGGAVAGLLGEVRHDVELREVMRASLLRPTREGLESIYHRALERGEISEPADGEAAAHLVVGAIMMAAVFASPGDGSSGDTDVSSGDRDASPGDRAESTALAFPPGMVDQLVRGLTP